VTVAEFLNSLDLRTTRDKCLAVLYYKQRFEKATPLTIERIRSALLTARVPKASKINVSDLIAKCGPYVDSEELANNRRSWSVTEAGERYLLGLPSALSEIEQEVSTLETLAAKIKNADAREYIEEANRCIKVGALRAGIVFVWAGAIRTIQEKCIAGSLSSLSASLARHDPKARSVTKIEDFQYIKDKNILLAAEDNGILDKAERTTLSESLDLRNRCGHPNKYRPGIKKASSFIEDVIGIVFK
jgi:hypothetical protein